MRLEMAGLPFPTVLCGHLPGLGASAYCIDRKPGRRLWAAQRRAEGGPGGA
jgi:hypothetical protein